MPVEPRPEFAAALLRRMEGLDEPAAHQAATVRYFVTGLDAAVAFYRDLLGFEEELRPSPAFAMLYRGDLRLLLSVPGGGQGGGAPLAGFRIRQRAAPPRRTPAGPPAAAGRRGG